MDLDHYKIESMKAVSEGKCLIVGFALTAFKDITWYLYCTAPITHTWKTFRLVHSDLNSQLFHCFTSPFWRSKGRRRDMRQVPKKNHRSVCISFLGTLHCVKYWHTCQYIFGTPPQQSLTEGTISALWALSQWSQLLTKSFTAPSCALTSPWLQAPGLDMPPTRNQNALAFPKCFISLLCLELVCTSQKNLVSSVLEDKPWHFKCFPSWRNIVTIYHPV